MNAIDQSEATTEEPVEVEREDDPVEDEAEQEILVASLRYVIG